MFADLALAQRIEAAEADLSASCAKLAGAAGKPSFVMSLSGGVAAFARPQSPINKVIGAGLGGALDLAQLEAIERAYAERNEAVRLELATLAQPDIMKALSARGYRLDSFENVLGLRLPVAADQRRTSMVLVERATDVGAWRDTLIDGFRHPDDSPVAGESYPREVLEEAMQDFVAMDGLARFSASIEGQPAGAASARFHGGVALLCGASTLPAMRRRGVQSALIQGRLAEAQARGCDVAIVTTAPASRSMSSVMQHGFTLLYARAILVRPLGTTADGRLDIPAGTDIGPFRA